MFWLLCSQSCDCVYFDMYKRERKMKRKKKKSCCRSFILFCSFFSCSGSEILTFCVLNGYELSCLPWCCNFSPNGSWIHNPQFTLNLQGEELPIELELIGIFFFPFQNHKICLSLLQGLEVVQAGTYCCPSRMYRKWSSHYCSFWAYRWTSTIWLAWWHLNFCLYVVCWQKKLEY